MKNTKVNNICSVKTKMFLALVTVICLIQSFRQHTAKEKQPVYNNKVKMYVRLFRPFSQRPLRIIGEPINLSLSRQLLLFTDADLTS